MSKELTPLDALEEIKHTTDLYRPNELNGYKEELDIIETALKDYQVLKNKYDVLETEYCDQQRSMLKYDEVKDKKFKAFEIIKEKNVNVFYLKNANSVEEYNIGLDLPKIWQLTQEEFDLLEEVLL